MKRFFLVMLGLTLIAICAAWFLGPLQDLLMGTGGDVRGVPGEASSELQTQGNRSGRRPRQSGLDINTVLNFANAAIGFVGLLLTVRAGRAKPDVSA